MSVTTISEYLDRELGLHFREGSDMEDPIKDLLGSKYVIFERLLDSLYSAWSNSPGDISGVIEAEMNMWRFIYSELGLDEAALNLNRQDEEKALEFIFGHLRAGSILDVGCGSGIKTVAYSLIGGHSVLGVDVSPEALSLLNVRLLRYPNAKVGTMQGNLLTLNLGTRYDNVLAANMLHEWGDNHEWKNPNLEMKISSLYRHTIAGGRAICTLKARDGACMPQEVARSMKDVGFENVRGEVFDRDYGGSLVGIIGERII